MLTLGNSVVLVLSLARQTAVGVCSFANPGDGMQAGRGGLVGGAHHVTALITAPATRGGLQHGESCAVPGFVFVGGGDV